MDTLGWERPHHVAAIAAINLQPLIAVHWSSNITTASEYCVTAKLLLAYLAGVIDSDGSIGIKRSTYAMRVRGDSTVPIYSERVMCRQVTLDAIQLLKDTFGGYLGVTKSYAVNGKPLYSWQVTDLKAVACLRALRPFLRVKAAQADNALALRTVKDASRAARTPFGRGHVGGIHRPEAFGLDMERLFLEAQRLNAVGVHTPIQ